MDPELIDRLRADLDAAGYGVDAVSSLLGSEADGARLRGVFAPARRVLAQRGPGPLATLVRLLLLGEAVAADEVDAALPELGADGACELGLLARDERGGLRAALSLNPVRVEDSALDDARAEWRILSDLDDQLRRGPARPDHVMGVGGATRSLVSLIPPAGAPRALDLGTGCGIVALHLAHRAGPAGTVVATDISERALRLAAANARLNGVDGVEFRRGSLFEPVAEERFDLIVSNPPFVITPRSSEGESGRPRYEYRDGGLVGDALAESVVVDGPRLLAPGGQLLCLANWECPWGEDGLGRVRAWIEAAASGGDGELAAWVIERDRLPPERYAETWARDGGARPGDAEFERLMEAWLDDFAARRVAAVGLGSIRVARIGDGDRAGDGADRRSGSPTVRLERASGSWGARPGEALQEAFDDAIACERMDDAEVLAAHWLRDEAVVEERVHEPGAEAPSELTLVTSRGIARRVGADPLLAAAVGACDGDLSLAQIADALAQILEVDADAARDALVSGVRELVWLGMLRRPSRSRPRGGHRAPVE